MFLLQSLQLQEAASPLHSHIQADDVASQRRGQRRGRLCHRLEVNGDLKDWLRQLIWNDLNIPPRNEWMKEWMNERVNELICVGTEDSWDRFISLTSTQCSQTIALSSRHKQVNEQYECSWDLGLWWDGSAYMVDSLLFGQTTCDRIWLSIYSYL